MDRHAAAVIHRRVLANGHRALICYGLDHLTRGRSVGLHIQLQTG